MRFALVREPGGPGGPEGVLRRRAFSLTDCKGLEGPALPDWERVTRLEEVDERLLVEWTEFGITDGAQKTHTGKHPRKGGTKGGDTKTNPHTER